MDCMILDGSFVGGKGFYSHSSYENDADNPAFNVYGGALAADQALLIAQVCAGHGVGWWVWASWPLLTLVCPPCWPLSNCHPLFLAPVDCCPSLLDSFSPPFRSSSCATTCVRMGRWC